MLKGIDISAYQDGMDVASVVKQNGLDFVIVKATEGTKIVQGTCDPFISAAVGAGAKVGFYHVFTSVSPEEQAEFFYNNCTGYIGKYIPVLDVEGSSSYYPNDPAGALRFLKRFEELSGVKPIVYMNGNCVATADWSGVVSNNNGLWLANYYYGYDTVGYDIDTSHMSSPGEFKSAAIWQFTSSGRLAGYNGNLDLDIAFMTRDAWDKYAASSKVSTPAAPTAPGGSTIDLAVAVMQGKYGDGDARRKALGTRYDEVQGFINHIYSTANATLAREVIAGKYGNGSTRKILLGNKYTAVQNLVNKMV